VILNEDDRSMELDKGVVQDIRCLLLPKQELVLKKDNLRLPAKSSAWTFLTVVRVPVALSSIDVNTPMGCLFGVDQFAYSMGARNMLELTNWGSPRGETVWWVKPSSQNLRTGEWCVVSFTACSKSVRFHVNGKLLDVYTIREKLESTNGDEHTSGDIGANAECSGNIRGCLFIGGSRARRKSFSGEIARLVIYNRALLDTEVEMLVKDYLNPRLVAISCFSCTNSVTAGVKTVKFMFSNGAETSYGREYVEDDEDIEQRTLELGCDEYIVAVSGSKSVFVEHHLANGFSAKTNKQNRIEAGVAGELDWEFKTTDNSEIVGLAVVSKTYEGLEVTSVLETRLLSERDRSCKHQVESGYLGLLRPIKQEVNRLVREKHLPQDFLPAISDWRQDAYWQWQSALDAANRELPRVLEDCVFDPGQASIEVVEWASMESASLRDELSQLKQSSAEAVEALEFARLREELSQLQKSSQDTVQALSEAMERVSMESASLRNELFQLKLSSGEIIETLRSELRIREKEMVDLIAEKQRHYENLVVDIKAAYKADRNQLLCDFTTKKDEMKALFEDKLLQSNERAALPF
jgi:hypothetical protein